MARILVVEDQRELAKQVATALRQSGYVVDTAANGEDAQVMGETGNYALVVLDLGLPLLDGISILEGWRRRRITAPVVILSARDSWRDKVRGLRAGADDYLAKPFAMEELMARIEALLRRGGGGGALLEWGDLAWDPAGKRVDLAGTPLRLTAMEYRILTCLLRQRDKVVSKSELAEQVYEQGVEGESNSLEVIITRLRRKIGAERIVTHRGLGYQLVTGGDDAP